MSGEKVEGEMVHLAEGSSVKGAVSRVGPLTLRLREGGCYFVVILRRIPLFMGGGVSVNDTTPEHWERNPTFRSTCNELSQNLNSQPCNCDIVLICFCGSDNCAIKLYKIFSLNRLEDL